MFNAARRARPLSRCRARIFKYKTTHSNLVREGLRGRARCVAPRASADVASAAWSGRALAVGVIKDLGGLDVSPCGIVGCSVWVDPSAEHRVDPDAAPGLHWPYVCVCVGMSWAMSWSICIQIQHNIDRVHNQFGSANKRYYALPPIPQWRASRQQGWPLALTRYWHDPNFVCSASEPRRHDWDWRRRGLGAGRATGAGVAAGGGQPRAALRAGRRARNLLTQALRRPRPGKTPISIYLSIYIYIYIYIYI